MQKINFKVILLFLSVFWSCQNDNDSNISEELSPKQIQYQFNLIKQSEEFVAIINIKHNINYYMESTGLSFKELKDYAFEDESHVKYSSVITKSGINEGLVSFDMHFYNQNVSKLVANFPNISSSAKLQDLVIREILKENTNLVKELLDEGKIKGGAKKDCVEDFDCPRGYYCVRVFGSTSRICMDENTAFSGGFLDEVIVTAPYYNPSTPYVPQYTPPIYTPPVSPSPTYPYYDFVGGGGSSSSNANWNVNNILLTLAPPETPIKDVGKFFECFDITKTAVVTVYADQPIVGTSTPIDLKNLDPGHAFVSIKQNDRIVTFGFYPNSEGVKSLLPASSILGNNGGDHYDVSISITVSGSILSKVLSKAKNYPTIYDINSFNCTNYARDIGITAGIGIPSAWGGIYPNGGGGKIQVN